MTTVVLLDTSVLPLSLVFGGPLESHRNNCQVCRGFGQAVFVIPRKITEECNFNLNLFGPYSFLREQEAGSINNLDSNHHVQMTLRVLLNNITN